MDLIENTSTRKFARSFGFLAAILAALWSLPASAGTMLEPVSASTDIPSFSLDQASPMNVVNQSGLWNTYTSGVTDFDTFMASGPPHSNGGGWVSGYFALTGNFDFDLGGSYSIAGLALWSLNDGTAIGDFRLLASDDATFANSTLLGAFTNNPPGGRFNFNDPQVFRFAATNAAFVRIEILSNQGSIFNTSILEAAFDASSASAVPEPSSVVMMGLGAVGIGGMIARRLRAA